MSILGKWFWSFYIGIDRAVSNSVDVISIGEHLPFKPNIANLVLCTQMLEHAEFPEEVLKEIYSVLAPGGFLTLSTHGIWLEEHEPSDFWRWTYQGLKKTLGSTGFRVIDDSSMKPYLSLIQILLLYIPQSLFSRYFIYPFFNTVAKFLTKALNNRGPKLYLVHVITAKKPNQYK